jgi:exo-beta-1,3-glucanase (GH17 family)
VAGAWWQLGVPQQIAGSSSDKLPCLSYAPFRGNQDPRVPGTQVPAAQIAEDLVQLAKVTGCIRIYSVANGLEHVPALARDAGLKVILGLWLANNTTVTAGNRHQMETAIALARAYPDVVTAVVVGNEVLLRGEMSPQELAGFIRQVKSQVGSIPVTYADVWEFWLRSRELADAVDFVTIHILPYWEDFPVRATLAVDHVDRIRRRAALAFPNKDILIGETGWPSAGRMRDAALPSPVNQARVVTDILALAKRDGFRVNLIEAYDQPWKRDMEGTVGGYWGIFDAAKRVMKFTPGQPVSNFPWWRVQMGAGVAYAALIFVVAFVSLRHRPWSQRWFVWPSIAIWAVTGGVLLGIAAEKALLESLGLLGWARSGMLLAVGFLAPLLAASALMTRRGLPTFAELIGPRTMRTRWPETLALGACWVVGTLLAAEAALGFVFDPRYRDFPYAPLSMIAVPFLGLAIFRRARLGPRPHAELAFAGLFAVAAVYVCLNEGLKNWQSLWTCACFALIAFIMLQARVAQSRE